jgi:dihydrolipoamide dehydrogenase
VTKGLGLETVGLEVDKRGVLPNKGHRTAVDGIWVIGDVTSGPMLAHKAEDEAGVCVERIVGKKGELNYNLIPNVIYTQPELASVGKTEEQLKAEGRAYKVGKFPFSANSRAKVNHETDGFAKVLADERTDEILGVHLVGPSVSEMIAEYCVAMEFAASAEDIALTCHPHPTRSEALRQAAMAVGGHTTQA